MNLFHREKYFQTQQLLKDFVLNYSGSPQVDSAQFYLGRCTFELEDNLTAADEFKRVVSQYPFSKLVGDAAYWEARSYFEQSPAYGLDQTCTKQALDAFQRYLEDYAGHALNDSAYQYITQCRNKLARKEYSSAKLYYDLGEYASSVLYGDGILANYYDTQWAEPAQYLKARCFDALGNHTRARQEYETYLEKYPSGKHAGTARRALASL
jgi:outer membrane protein assembly factor BamD